jgi:hypothetical protein
MGGSLHVWSHEEHVMTKVLCLAALAAMLSIGAVGCKSDNSHSSDDPKMMSADACSHCPGKQTATADGKCPVCGMKAHPAQ